MDNLLLTKELDRFYYLWRESIAIYEDWAKQYGLSNMDYLTWIGLSNMDYLTMLLWLWKDN